MFEKLTVPTLVLLIFVVSISYSQNYIQWQKCLGGSDADYAHSIIQTTEGGYIVAGYSHSNDVQVSGNYGGYDYWVVKLTSSGILQWENNFGGSDHDWAHSIIQTTDGGYIVAGYTESDDEQVIGSNGWEDIWVVKLTSSGDFVWQKCLGGSGEEVGSKIIQTTDGGYIVAGVTRSNDGQVSGNHGGTDYWVVKLTSSGDFAWQKCLGGSDFDGASSIIQTTDGGYIVAGSSRSNDGDVSGNHGLRDYWVVKLTSSGDFVWQKCFGGSGWDRAHSIIQTTDGGYIVVGTSDSNDGDVSGNHGLIDNWVVKLTSSGDLAWQKCLGGSDYDYAYSIIQTTDGGYIVAGESKSNDGQVSCNHGGWDYWVVKLTSSGDFVWQKSLGGSDGDGARSIIQITEDSYIVAGYCHSNDGEVLGNHGSADYWVVSIYPTNQPPIANAGPDQTVECATTEGTIVILDASGSSDCDNDPLTYTWSEDATTISGPTSEPLVEVMLSSGEHLIELTVDDGNGGIDIDQVMITVLDTESPEIIELILPIDPVQTNSEVKAGASFIESCSDVTATWDWGDGETSEGIVDQDADTVSGSHVYQIPGIYSVKLTLTDCFGNLSESTYQFVVVFDPSAGFVTGGGWINSPPGAYTPDPSLAGKANFGFVSKYRKGQSTPEGNTQFQFKVADFKFSSISYDWLVIAGPNAKYKGSGTINGDGDYGFMLTARDGDIKGGEGLDKFRIKIWEKTTEEIEEEAIIYDNQMGDTDDAEATDIIEGGSIVIHRTALSKESSDNSLQPSTTEVIPEKYALEQNYPNPFNPTTTIKFALPEEAEVIMEIFNSAGQRIATLLNKRMDSGQFNVIWDASKMPSGIYFYRIKAGNFQDLKKMILMK